jgi:hypothetical protein
MIAHIYCNMRNEITLLPYFLRHYGSFADRLFIWDDDSDDGTRELLQACPRVTLLPLEYHGIYDPYRTEKLWPQYVQFSRGVADWVMCVDADEFVYHPRLVEVLEREKGNGVQIIHCKGFTMISDAPPTGPGQIYEEIPNGLPDRWSGKWIVFDPAIEIEFKSGRHGPPILGGDYRHAAHTGIRLLHYRYLGPDYYKARDEKHAKRMEVGDPEGKRYQPGKKHNLPDDTQGIALPWYARHASEAIDRTGEL